MLDPGCPSYSTMEPIHQSDFPLPPEIITLICSNLSKPDLLRLRLISHKLRDVAAPFAFRAFCLRAYGNSAKNFTHIAKSAHLRSHVKEITLDTNIGPDYEYHRDNSYELPHAFFNALPYLRCFRRLTKLHLRFSEYCGDEYTDQGVYIEETWPFRYRILDTVFHCVVGLWTKSKQIEIDQRAELEDFEAEYPDDDPELVPGCGNHLEELNISNLADYHDPGLASSAAFHKLLSLPSLRDLKLLITTEEHRSIRLYLYPQEMHEFFQKLPSTWMCPSLTDHLRTLSLYYNDQWGWYPRMNLYEIGPLPHLKVLALGNFVFSEKRQTDWFTTIGKNNGSGGLEELYLDDCPIIFEASQVGPLNNDGYPDPPIIDPEEFYDPSLNAEFSMRWHHVLEAWRGGMKGLNKFFMGDEEWTPLWPNAGAVKQQEEYQDVGCNADPKLGQTSVNGTGLSQRRRARMQYISFAVGSCPPWITPYRMWDKEVPGKGWAPEEDTVGMDDAAFELFMMAIQDRTSGRGMA